MATYNIAQKYIGSGIVFPLNLVNGKPPILVGDIELINSSLGILLTWQKSQRFLLGEFGSRIEQLIGEQNDEVLAALALQFANDAINTFETRLELLESEIIRPNNTSINIRLSYKIRNTNITNSFIFPFYKKPTY